VEEFLRKLRGWPAAAVFAFGTTRVFPKELAQGFFSQYAATWELNLLTCNERDWIFKFARRSRPRGTHHGETEGTLRGRSATFQELDAAQTSS
jgi:hypothetical protein